MFINIVQVKTFFTSGIVKLKRKLSTIKKLCCPVGKLVKAHSTFFMLENVAGVVGSEAFKSKDGNFPKSQMGLKWGVSSPSQSYLHDSKEHGLGN